MRIDYLLLSGDAFAEFPVGSNTITFEAGFSKLDFDDGQRATSDSTWVDLRNSQGTGFYAQGGFLVNKTWQPWAEVEQWNSDATGNVGSYQSFRVGITYFLQGQNANLKAGLESFKPDVPPTTSDDSFNSIVVGAYLTY